MAANDGKLYIIITDESQGGGGTNPSPVPPRPTPQKPQTTAESSGDNGFIKHQFYNFIENQAKQFVNYAINNIGNFTGNYQSQANLQAGIQLMNQVKGIGMSVAAGAQMGGPYGAIAGAIISVVSTAINYAYSDYSYGVEIKKQNRYTDELRKLSGLDSRTNGSRI